VDAAVSSRHGILRLYDDQDVGIQFVHVHPVLAVARNKNDQMARKWACRGSSNFIVQPGKHKRVTPIDI
jgi:hypothetical protein